MIAQIEQLTRKMPRRQTHSLTFHAPTRPQVCRPLRSQSPGSSYNRPSQRCAPPNRDRSSFQQLVRLRCCAAFPRASSHLSPEKASDQKQHDRAEQAAHEYDFLPGPAEFDFATTNLVGRPFRMRYFHCLQMRTAARRFRGRCRSRDSFFPFGSKHH